MVNKKIVIICSIIALIIVGAIVRINIKKFNDAQNSMNEVKANQDVRNEINSENQISNENNAISEEENEVSENLTNQEQIKGEEETKPESNENKAENTVSDNTNNEEEESGDEAAINLAKKEWGEDDNTVYYTIDTKSNDTYTISVRSKSTTEQLAEYEVDVKEQTAVIK